MLDQCTFAVTWQKQASISHFAWFGLAELNNHLILLLEELTGNTLKLIPNYQVKSVIELPWGETDPAVSES